MTRKRRENINWVILELVGTSRNLFGVLASFVGKNDGFKYHTASHYMNDVKDAQVVTLQKELVKIVAIGEAVGEFFGMGILIFYSHMMTFSILW